MGRYASLMKRTPLRKLTSRLYEPKTERMCPIGLVYNQKHNIKEVWEKGEGVQEPYEFFSVVFDVSMVEVDVFYQTFDGIYEDEGVLEAKEWAVQWMEDHERTDRNCVTGQH